MTSPATATKALLRGAELLGLTENLPAILDITAEEFAPLRAGARCLDPAREEWQHAMQLIGLFRSLVALVGRPERARDWLVRPNPALKARPIDVLTSPDRDRLYHYVDAVAKHELWLPGS